MTELAGRILHLHSSTTASDGWPYCRCSCGAGQTAINVLRCPSVRGGVDLPRAAKRLGERIHPPTGPPAARGAPRRTPRRGARWRRRVGRSKALRCLPPLGRVARAQLCGGRTECPRCQGGMKLLAIIKEQSSIARYLAAVGEPTEAPRRSLSTGRRTGTASAPGPSNSSAAPTTTRPPSLWPTKSRASPGRSPSVTPTTAPPPAQSVA